MKYLLAVVFVASCTNPTAPTPSKVSKNQLLPGVPVACHDTTTTFVYHGKVYSTRYCI